MHSLTLTSAILTMLLTLTLAQDPPATLSFCETNFDPNAKTLCCPCLLSSGPDTPCATQPVADITNCTEPTGWGCCYVDVRPIFSCT
jgi:hypothetical protein